MPPSTTASSVDERARIGRRMLAVIAVLFAAPLLGLNVPTVIAGVRAQRWPTVPGTISDQFFTDERVGRQSGGDSSRLHVQYEYAFDGDAYSGSRITPARSWIRSTAAARARYAIGKVVPVHVSPDDANIAALDVGLPWGAMALSVVGVALLAWAVKLLVTRQGAAEGTEGDRVARAS